MPASPQLLHWHHCQRLQQLRPFLHSENHQPQDPPTKMSAKRTVTEAYLGFGQSLDNLQGVKQLVRALGIQQQVPVWLRRLHELQRHQVVTERRIRWETLQ